MGWSNWQGGMSFVFGALVGFSEIISRYRDEPLRATTNRYGLFYLMFNGILAVAAYTILSRYPGKIFPDFLTNDPFLTAIVAGFGSMTVLRSKLFIFRADDGKEYPIGPAIVIETFLRVLDRKIDRLRASRRQQLVFEHMQKIEDFEVAAQYLEASLLSFQNLSSEEKSAIVSVIDDYRQQQEWPPPH